MIQCGCRRGSVVRTDEHAAVTTGLAGVPERSNVRIRPYDEQLLRGSRVRPFRGSEVTRDMGLRA